MPSGPGDRRQVDSRPERPHDGQPRGEGYKGVRGVRPQGQEGPARTRATARSSSSIQPLQVPAPRSLKDVGIKQHPAQEEANQDAISRCKVDLLVAAWSDGDARRPRGVISCFAKLLGPGAERRGQRRNAAEEPRRKNSRSGAEPAGGDAGETTVTDVEDGEASWRRSSRSRSRSERRERGEAAEQAGVKTTPAASRQARADSTAINRADRSAPTTLTSRSPRGSAASADPTTRPAGQRAERAGAGHPERGAEAHGRKTTPRRRRARGRRPRGRASGTRRSARNDAGEDGRRRCRGSRIAERAEVVATRQ